ncbi:MULTISPECIES: CvpA family protein [unclassified Lebetimonas]|uniref:CvpA family protein n=1 Tax=unclassified Lebetimonas TaxID=2648158 RepID=UPI0004649BC9|nr:MULTISPECIES: CvpA family protein [unclassified Lebetimonas]
MWFDAVIIGITLILAIKGFFNGFVKEIAGLIGLIGGLWLAREYFHSVGIYIDKNLFAIKNYTAIDLVGFIVVFVGFWISVVFIGFLINKILKMSSLGALDKILGFIFAGLKFFLLISVIIALLYKVEFIKEKTRKYIKNSITFPICLKAGEKIINLSPKDLEKLSKNVKISKK